MFRKPVLQRSLAGLFLGLGLLTGCSRQEAGKPQTTAPGRVESAAARELSGGRDLRAVWLEDFAAEGAPMARQVFGLNSADPAGIRRLGGESGDLARPLITPDGQAVVFTRLGLTKTGSGFTFAPQVIWQPWDGSASKALGAGMAVDLWKNPADGATYVYAVRSLQPSPAASAPALRLTGEILLRFRADKPEDQEILWTAAPLNAEQFQLSRDGRRAAGAFPFPKAGLANLEDQTFTPLAAGAWAVLAPDDSYAAAVLDGSRKRLRVFAPNLERGWDLALAGAEGWPETAGMLAPRWSNDARLLTFTGPFEGEGVASGDVRLVSLRGDLRRAEKTVALTTGRKALTPSVWIDGGGAEPSTLPQEPVVLPKPELKPWPGTEDGLVFAWESARKEERAKPLPMAPASLKPGGFATVGRNFEMNLSGGWYDADEAAAAKITQACAASNAWSMELILTERTSQPPLSVRLASLIQADGRENFALYRVDRKLVLRVLLGGSPERPAAVYPVILSNLAIEGDRPVHVLVTLRNNRLSCWVDGQMMRDFELENSGLGAWGPGKLSFGDPQPYGTPWTGWMERVAIYSRALTEEECRAASATAEQWITGRRRPTRSKILGRLVDRPALSIPVAAATPAPAGQGTGNDPGAGAAAGGPGNELVLSVWQVEQVFMGQLEASRIVLAEWGKLHGRAVPLTPAEPGKPVELWLESWEDHPELEGEPVQASSQAEGLPRFFLGRALSPPAPGRP